MSAKKQNELNTYINIEQKENKLFLCFYSNCGNFGTNEILDEYELTPKELLDILQKKDKN